MPIPTRINPLQPQRRALHLTVLLTLTLAGCVTDGPQTSAPPAPEHAATAPDAQQELELATALAAKGFSARLQSLGSELDEIIGYAPDEEDGRRLFDAAMKINDRFLNLQERWLRITVLDNGPSITDFLPTAWPELEALASDVAGLRSQLLNLYVASAGN